MATKFKKSKIDHKSRDIYLTTLSNEYSESAYKTALIPKKSAPHEKNFFFREIFVEISGQKCENLKLTARKPRLRVSVQF